MWKLVLFYSFFDKYIRPISFFLFLSIIRVYKKYKFRSFFFEVQIILCITKQKRKQKWRAYLSFKFPKHISVFVIVTFLISFKKMEGYFPIRLVIKGQMMFYFM